MAATYEPIASTTLGSDTSFIEFMSIPGTFTDLYAVGSFSLSTGTAVSCYVNSVSTTCSNTYLMGDGSSASSARATGLASLKIAYMNSANTIGDFQVHFMSYANTNVYKTTLSAWNSTSATSFPNMGRFVNLSQTTSAITSLKFYSESGNFKAGTVIGLYGLKAA